MPHFPPDLQARIHTQSELSHAKQACHPAKPFHQGLRKRVICCLHYYANQGDAVHLPKSSGNSGNEDESAFDCVCVLEPLWTSYLQRAVLGHVKKNVFPSLSMSLLLSRLSAFLHLLWEVLLFKNLKASGSFIRECGECLKMKETRKSHHAALGFFKASYEPEN